MNGWDTLSARNRYSGTHRFIAPTVSGIVRAQRNVLENRTSRRAASRAQQDTTELLATIGELLVPLR